MTLVDAMKAIDAQVKTCTKCGEVKPLTEFHRDRSRKSGLSSHCKMCACELSRQWRLANPDRKLLATREWRRANPDSERNRWLKKRHGLTREQYDAMVLAQAGACAICGSMTSGGFGVGLRVDHDHESGVIRGLLCHACNTALGSFRDSPEILKQAISYLESTRVA